MRAFSCVVFMPFSLVLIIMETIVFELNGAVADVKTFVYRRGDVCQDFLPALGGLSDHYVHAHNIFPAGD